MIFSVDPQASPSDVIGTARNCCWNRGKFIRTSAVVVAASLANSGLETTRRVLASFNSFHETWHINNNMDNLSSPVQIQTFSGVFSQSK